MSSRGFPSPCNEVRWSRRRTRSAVNRAASRPPKEPDRALPRVNVVKVRDEEELTAVYVREYGRLVGLLTAIGRSSSEAEETAQEAFIRLIEHWPRVRGYDDPAAWLRTVAIRLLISRHRRTDVARRALAFLGSGAAAPGDAAPETRIDLDAAFSQLSAEQRAVVVLHHLYDLPVDEIARGLRLPAGTVKSRLARARIRLGPLLTEHERTHHD